MGVRITNSLTKKKEALPLPEEQKTIKMYSCGVTVYDRCHIGHARSLYTFEVIRRYLKYRGYDMRFVRNITDVDDKIINKANETGKTFEEVAKENIEGYKNDLKLLDVPSADVEPCATQNIELMIAHIEKLIDKGMAYESGGDVYFEVRKFADYGKLSGQSIEKMKEGARITPGENKKDPLDFALWKKSKEGEPHWMSPWGEGRPGWHIECSAMSMKHLDTETLDIHAGGRDLIFPHHENEIAQSEALTGKPFAKYWIHHGLLTINGQKMAKSLGNFITIKDAVEKYGADCLKLFFLSSHYASPIDFSTERVEEAKKSLEKIKILYLRIKEEFGTFDLQTKFKQGTSNIGQYKYKQTFIENMDDDFNTPKALSVIFEIIRRCNLTLDGDEELKGFILRDAIETLEKYFEIFCLDVHKNPLNEKLTQEEEALLAERVEVRSKKNYKRSDEIRNLLRIKGIVVEDTKDGQSWRKM